MQKVAVVVGSARRESINRKLGQALARLAEGKFAATLVRIDDLPMFNQDMESDPPAAVLRFKAEIAAADGVMLVTPEHNRSIPALLKNAIDWGTRPYGKNVWGTKPVAITGTSGGAVATAVAQGQLRQIMCGVSAGVMGAEVYINFKPGLIDDAGTIADDSVRNFLAAFVDKYATFLRKLA